MKARLITKNGKQWDFPTVEEARRHIKMGGRKTETYDAIDQSGEKIRIIDERETGICPYCHGTGDIFRNGQMEASVCPTCRGAGVVAVVEAPPWDVVEPEGGLAVL